MSSGWFCAEVPGSLCAAGERGRVACAADFALSMQMGSSERTLRPSTEVRKFFRFILTLWFNIVGKKFEKNIIFFQNGSNVFEPDNVRFVPKIYYF
jgi:hypothetical protein